MCPSGVWKVKIHCTVFYQGFDSLDGLVLMEGTTSDLVPLVSGKVRCPIPEL